MSCIPLSASAKKFIVDCNFTPKGKKIVERCVSRYSTPHSFSQALSYVVYRIANAFLSIFNQSDWQLAEKVIHENFKKKADLKNKVANLLPTYPQVPNKKKVDQILKSSWDKLAVLVSKIVLKGLVRLNDKAKTSKQMIAPTRLIVAPAQKLISSIEKEMIAKLVLAVK